MNELAKLTPLIFNGCKCQITDHKGNPWFAAKDVAEILGIKYYRQTLSSFPDNEKSYIVCAVTSNDGTLSKSRARKTQKVLIINVDGLFRLIQNSRKPEVKRIKERFTKILADIFKYGINRSSLPKLWLYRGNELTWGEYINKKCENYLKLHPDKDFDDFLATLPY